MPNRISRRSMEWDSRPDRFHEQRERKRGLRAPHSTPLAEDSPAQTSTCVSVPAAGAISDEMHSSRSSRRDFNSQIQSLAPQDLRAADFAEASELMEN